MCLFSLLTITLLVTVDNCGQLTQKKFWFCGLLYLVINWLLGVFKTEHNQQVHQHYVGIKLCR